MPRRSDTLNERQVAFVRALKEAGFTPLDIEKIFKVWRHTRTDAEREATAARVRKYRQRHAKLIPVALSTDPNATPLMVGPATAKALEIVNRATVEIAGPVGSGMTESKIKPRRLAEDWTMDASAVDYGKNLGLSEKDVMREAVKFRNYWTSKGSNATKTNWKRTFENWLITASERTGKPNGKSQHENSIGAAAERLADRGDFAIKPRPVLSPAGKNPDGSVSD